MTPHPLDIPDFLRLTQEERNVAWLRRPLVAAPPMAKVPQRVIPDLPEDLKIDMAARKKLKADKRLANMLAGVRYREIPAPFRHWDPRQSRFVDERIEQKRRLEAAARRLGITLNITEDDMAKLTIVPYLAGKDLPHTRGKTSIKDDASESDIHKKVAGAAIRAGRQVQRVEVIDEKGELKGTWTVDEGYENLYDGSGATISLAAVVANEEGGGPEQESDMAKKAKTKTASKKKSNGAGGNKGVGVIATILEAMGRDRGATAEEMVAILTKKFPDRKAEGMTSTVKIQAARNAKKKDKDEKRGLVYYR